MATLPGAARRTAATRSGGKILRNRRLPAAETTPYARPKPPDPAAVSESENPNWLSGLIYPARMIATGAGKIYSTIFGGESSSSSSSGGCDGSDYDDDDINEVSSQEDDQLKKVSESVAKSKNKHLIEQLVMQETFSREECDELIKLIKLRVIYENEDSTAPDMRATAVREARKWLEKMKLGSGSKRKLDIEIIASDSTPSQVTRNEVGSPVDMAKSFMQTRPAWASPQAKHVEFGSPLPMSMPYSKEETPESKFPSSELRRNSRTSGSWNILEEIRRVRAKAAENFVTTPPSKKSDLSPLPLENETTQDLLTERRNEVEAEACVELQLDVVQTEALPTNDASPLSRLNQDGDNTLVVEDGGGVADTAGAGPSPTSSHIDELKASEKDIQVSPKVNGPRSPAVENGFPSSISSLRVAQEGKGNAVASTQDGIEENTAMNKDDVDHDNKAATNKIDAVEMGSQDSSSVRNDEMSEDSTPQKPKRTVATKVNPTKSGGKKSRGYTRRARGRTK